MRYYLSPISLKNGVNFFLFYVVLILHMFAMSHVHELFILCVPVLTFLRYSMITCGPFCIIYVIEKRRNLSSGSR